MNETSSSVDTDRFGIVLGPPDPRAVTVSTTQINQEQISRANTGKTAAELTENIDRSMLTSVKLLQKRAECVHLIRNKAIKKMRSLISTSSSEAIYYGPATHRNLGDNLLVLGSIKVLRLHFCNSKKTALIHHQDAIFIFT